MIVWLYHRDGQAPVTLGQTPDDDAPACTARVTTDRGDCGRWELLAMGGLLSIAYVS